jgi:hypothetical protein
MNDVTTLSAEALLAIRPSEPERLFTGDEAVANQEFRALASRSGIRTVARPLGRPKCSSTSTGCTTRRFGNCAAASGKRRACWCCGRPTARPTNPLPQGTRIRAGAAVRRRRDRGLCGGKEHADLFENALQVIDRLPCADSAHGGGNRAPPAGDRPPLRDRRGPGAGAAENAGSGVAARCARPLRRADGRPPCRLDRQFAAESGVLSRLRPAGAQRHPGRHLVHFAAATHRRPARRLVVRGAAGRADAGRAGRHRPVCAVRSDGPATAAISAPIWN